MAWLAFARLITMVGAYVCTGTTIDPTPAASSARYLHAHRRVDRKCESPSCISPNPCKRLIPSSLARRDSQHRTPGSLQSNSIQLYCCTCLLDRALGQAQSAQETSAAVLRLAALVLGLRGEKDAALSGQVGAVGPREVEVDQTDGPLPLIVAGRTLRGRNPGP